jgi:hypothetical protein
MEELVADLGAAFLRAGLELTPELLDGVADCALACTREGCDAFKYNRGGPATNGKRYCYLHRALYTQLPDTADYVFGERDPKAQLLDPAMAEEAVRRAASAPLPAVVDDGLTRCANGPVKVTNFKLTLNVANINQCAAQCTPKTNCAAFAFNAADADGTHLCQLLAPGYQPRNVSGWISGVRGTNSEITGCSAMNRDIDAPADDLRDEAARAKREAEATADPKKKEQLKEIAKDDQAKAIDIENDVA